MVMAASKARSDRDRDIIEEAVKRVSEEFGKNEQRVSKTSKILDTVNSSSISDKNDEHNHDNDISCPTCGKGHIHRLEGDGKGKVKCTGDGCGLKYNLIPDSADYRCETCGTPHQRASGSDDKCPMCGGEHFEPYPDSILKRIKKIK